MTQQETADFKRAQKYGFFTGTYATKDGPGRSWLLWFKREWIFTNDAENPLTYHHPDGYCIRPDNHFLTDWGSVPPVLQFLVPRVFARDRWPKSYAFHDSAYRHKGLWFAMNMHREFTFQKMPRPQIDKLLSTMIKAEGGNKFYSAPIWAGVRIGGWWSFDEIRDRRHPRTVRPPRRFGA